MTGAFVDGAGLMATALGAPGYRFAVIDHPIAAATDSELADKAEVTVEQAAELLQPDGLLDPSRAYLNRAVSSTRRFNRQRLRTASDGHRWAAGLTRCRQ